MLPIHSATASQPQSQSSQSRWLCHNHECNVAAAAIAVRLEGMGYEVCAAWKADVSDACRLARNHVAEREFSYAKPAMSVQRPNVQIAHQANVRNHRGSAEVTV